MAKFNVSGQNSNGFYDFCSGDPDVAYLHVCDSEKPEMERFVRGGMREENEIDSLSLATNPQLNRQNGKIKYSRRSTDWLISS